MNISIKQILVSAIILTAGVAIIAGGPTAHAGLNLSDAGEASCNGTLGGGQLSKSQLDDICRTYKENSIKNDTSSIIIIEVLKGAILLGVGAATGILFTKRKKKMVKK